MRKNTKKTILNPPNTAPKDGSIILGNFGYPWFLPAAWNDYDGKWATCAIQACPMEPDAKTDIWWENEAEDHNSLKGWLPFPTQKTPETFTK